MAVSIRLASLATICGAKLTCVRSRMASISLQALAMGCTQGEALRLWGGPLTPGPSPPAILVLHTPRCCRPGARGEMTVARWWGGPLTPGRSPPVGSGRNAALPPNPPWHDNLAECVPQNPSNRVELDRFPRRCPRARGRARNGAACGFGCRGRLLFCGRGTGERCAIFGDFGALRAAGAIGVLRYQADGCFDQV